MFLPEMNCQVKELLMANQDGVQSFKSTTVGIAVGHDAVLYRNPVHVLLSVAPESRFDICGINLQLRVPNADESMRTYYVELKESNKVHFYRRLLAQTALGVIGAEAACTQLVATAIDHGRLCKRALICALYPESRNNIPEWVMRMASPESFVRSVSGDQLIELLRCKLGANNRPFDLRFEVEQAGHELWTVAIVWNGECFESGIYARSPTVVCDVVMLHLLSDALALPPNRTVVA